MHQYPHHIGDFRGGTVNMTRLERWIYRDLLDVYYDKEQPLSLNLTDLCRDIGVRTDEEKAIVADLLGYKFVKTDQGYVHERCEEVLAEYRAKADVARENGKKGGRPRKEKKNPEKPSGFYGKPDGNPEETGSQANHKPLTVNLNSVPNGTDADASQGLTPHEAIFQIGLPWLVSHAGPDVKEANLRSMLGGAEKHLGETGAWQLVEDCMRVKPLEPVAWVAGAINERKKVANGSPPRNRGQPSGRNDRTAAAAAIFGNGKSTGEVIDV